MLKSLLAAAAVLVSTSAFAHSPGHMAAPAEMQLHAGPAVTVGDLEIAGAFSRATLPNAPVGGGYLTITNHGTTDDRLVGVATPVAGMAEVHEMKMDGDVMRMNKVPDGVLIPAGGTVALEPGGLHLMFMDLTAPLVEGQSVPVTLTFEKAGPVEVQVEVGSPAAKGPDMDHSMHSETTTPSLEDHA
jgi:copper(I)-binding protein